MDTLQKLAPSDISSAAESHLTQSHTLSNSGQLLRTILYPEHPGGPANIADGPTLQLHFC